MQVISKLLARLVLTNQLWVVLASFDTVVVLRKSKSLDMKALIIQNIKQLGLLVKPALQRLRARVCYVKTQAVAITCLTKQPYGIMVLDLTLEQDSAFAISDFAHYERSKVIFLLPIGPSFWTGQTIKTVLIFARICKIW